MNMTNLKLVVLVVATSVLTSICTSLLIKQSLLSSGGSGGFAAQPGQVMVEQRGMTLNQYQPPDPQALTDLENKVKDHQDAKETTNEITISLKPYVNCKLTDPLADMPNEKEHTLEALPAGMHTYGGVPFDVQGLIQLNGPSVQLGVKLWPLEVKDIAIGHSFKKLHLLQGAFNIVAPDAHLTFAKLILHYADGAQEELALTGGTQALRCVDASIPEELGLLDPSRTELGWIGVSPYLKKKNPGALLHLYRATLDNPKPDSEVKTIDYLSTMVNPGPFMAGLTIE
jgi:hypothetical protein